MSRREDGYEFYSVARRGDERAVLARCCDPAAVYWVHADADIAALLPKGANYVVDGARDPAVPKLCGNYFLDVRREAHHRFLDGVERRRDASSTRVERQRRRPTARASRRTTRGPL